ncbi:MAG: hypothetical protein L0Y68_04080 [Candidatus Dadabacteria bacterium]|nr:hypothetical protein [Candidatus Dadabacteria bacterium]
MNITNCFKWISHTALLYITHSSIHRIRFVPVVFILFLALFPLKAYPDCNASGDIPFTLNVDIPGDAACIQCGGPWGRVTDLIFFSEELVLCTFYAANKGTLSPFGGWDCSLFDFSIPGNDCDLGTLIERKSFCLKSGDTEVALTISKVGEGILFSIDKSAPDPICSPSTTSFLGDNPGQEKSRRDSDTFLFDGIAGDEVKLRLEANPQDGNNGGEASLGISGNSLDDEISGAPPLEIMATLPADGEYSITVRQPKNPTGLRFRGSYILNVESSPGGIGLIEPTNSVEK